MFIGFARCSLPITYTRATVPDSTRDGQGWKGYDTNHDTRKNAHQSRAPASAEWSSREGVGWGSRVLNRVPYNKKNEIFLCRARALATLEFRDSGVGLEVVQEVVCQAR